MTEQEREELIEKIAMVAAECGHDDWMHAENWFRDIYITRAAAALAVAEPVIREECAKMAEKRACMIDCCEATGVKIAAAIREGATDE